MLPFELLARFRTELLITGNAFYETVLAIAERVNRKVYVLRLHAQAAHQLQSIRTLHGQVGRRIADHLGSGAESAAQTPRPPVTDLAAVVTGAGYRLKQIKTEVMKTEGRIRELKREAADEELLAIQRDLMLHDAALVRVVVTRGAAVLSHPLGEFELPPMTRLVSVFRGPFMLPLSKELVVRPDDVVILVGLRADLDELLPHFHKQRTSKTAS
ncbi:MAG TPA: TrkA C-terminal domain-containing protein [Nitrospiraceae bacterium]|nr:TrkA C-terminal domain-containing protein [Nitrospiraceae bacterium]